MDELQKNTVEKLGLKSEKEYWETINDYLNNLFYDGKVMDEIYEYIQTHDIASLSMKSEMQIARDLFGGYKYGNKDR